MVKSFIDNRLCVFTGRMPVPHAAMIGRRCPAAFTLAELVVAVGILALMMALAGEVFSIAVKSTGQARAMTTVSQRLRLFEQTLRDDLAAVRREATIMVIQSNQIKAYWTAEDRKADVDDDPANGYPHPRDPRREDPGALDGSGGFHLYAPRADMLMFVTERAGRSVVDPKVTGAAQQVVYGHALQMEYQADATLECAPYGPSLNPADYPKKENERQFPSIEEDDLPAGLMPASQWHLARRALLLINEPSPAPDGCLQSEDHHLYSFFPNPNGDYPVEAGLRDFVFGFDYEAYVTAVVGALPPDIKETVDGYCTGPNAIDNVVDYTYKGHPDVGEQSRGDWIRRSILDVTLPAPIANRIGHYLLPHCASFKVEWTFDPDVLGGGDRVLWVDYNRCHGVPGPNGLYCAILNERDRAMELATQKGIPKASRDRFVARVRRLDKMLKRFDKGHDKYDPRFPKFADKECTDQQTCSPYPDFAQIRGIFWFPQTVWVDDDRPPKSVCIPRRDAYFPVALRITVDVYDDNMRLDRPVRHVMVIPVGNG